MRRLTDVRRFLGLLAFIFGNVAVCGCATMTASQPGGSLAAASSASAARNLGPRGSLESELGLPGGLQLRPRPQTASRRAWMSAHGVESRLYVSDYFADTIDVFSTRGTPVGAITAGISGPVGTCVDRKGTLYVANYGNDTVSEYLKDQTNPSAVLSTGINHPTAVALGPDDTLYVGEFANNVVLEFDKGATAPTATIASLTYPEGLTVDGGNNLYAAWNDKNYEGHVDTFPGDSTTGTDTGIVTGQTGDVKIDLAGNLVLANQAGHAIDIFAPGASSPARTIHTIGSDPYKFALDKKGTTLYVADPDTNTVLVFNYASGTQTRTIYQGLSSALGVSVAPAAQFHSR